MHETDAMCIPDHKNESAFAMARAVGRGSSCEQ